MDNKRYVHTQVLQVLTVLKFGLKLRNNLDAIYAGQMADEI